MSREEASAVRAELVAVQAVMIGVFRRLAEDQPDLTASFCRAFDEAETILSGVAVKMGIDAPDDCAIEALRVLDQIRSAVIRDERRCGEPEKLPARR